ncbi:hypothetical protein FIBSPDRAFT_851532 [Athelia psychrophila]|uniref:Uncharacterized protein n=1 Tax=Athelia psychrophila TaxID=1759441 RepID=A0A166SLE2_9AGAM|nr:hypothetical protein FIBSPDRAFT_851532 [Fibularhizoctonia sp. CBS 109695]
MNSRRRPGHSTSINYCDTWFSLSLILNGSISHNDTLGFLFISRHVYVNATFPSKGAAFLERVCNSAGLSRISRALLMSGLLYYGVTIGFQIISTTPVFFSLLYAELFDVVYVALAFALACRVSRVVLLCETEGYDGDGSGMGTPGRAVQGDVGCSAVFEE